MSAATVRNPVAPLEHYRAAFESRWASKDDALTRLRRAALERFLASGFPTQRHEDWKYTNLRRLEMRSFTPAATSALSLEAAQDRWIPEAGARIVLVNGHWMPALGSTIAQPPGVTLLTLAQWSSHDPVEVAAFLTSAAGSSDDAFEQLNLAFCEDGVVIDIADGIKAEPIYIVHQWSEHSSQLMSHPRVIVRVGRNSQCALIEQFVGPLDVEYFTNAVSVIDVGSGASVRHYRLQQESTKSFHIAQVSVRQQTDSRYYCHDVSLGASLGRTNITTLLEGSGAHVGLHGLFVPSGTQHMDVHTRIEHIARQTTSDEDYRGVAAGRGRGVFNGKVIVHPGAQKIDARQSSRNLLLSPNAEIDTKPELEIYAHDVKCSHGATTGQLDATALFYLRSRGLSETQARALLIRAFAESILSTIEHEPLRTWLEQRLDERFAAPSEVSA
jgi:Fe-S cluster assembly protein SufD